MIEFMRKTNTPVIKDVILDFDGTMADSLNVFIESLGEVLKEFMGLDEPLTSEKIAEYRKMSVLDLIRTSRIPLWKIPRLAERGKELVASKADRIELFDGIPELVGTLKENFRGVYIGSSNSEQAIRSILGRYGLENSMNKIYADTSVLGKAAMFKEIARKNHLVLNECATVGDEKRDIDAAYRVGAWSVAACYGYCPGDALKSHVRKPHAVALLPSGVATAIQSLQFAA